ncbi:MAG: slipin family protein [Spirochaetes bacterium]|nr:slipin family protein [Spirochaetota bacterium]
MTPFTSERQRVRQLVHWKLPRDFAFGPFSFITLLLVSGAGLAVEFARQGMEARHLAYAAGAVLAAAALISGVPTWATVIVAELALWIAYAVLPAVGSLLLAAIVSAGLLLAPSVQLVFQWDKALVLRMGRFRRVRGPGLVFLVPLVDRVAEFVDTRIRATDFTAEKTLTRDTVPVDVDAHAFWMIWDAQKAVLEVEHYDDAVTLSAQAALRDSIGRYDLTTLLTQRDTLCREIQGILDAKTNPWGITILSVEFTDIILPQALEDAMSRVAQAEREKQARVILAEAEVEIAEKFEEASCRYRENPTALNLRAMNMVYESMRQKGALMLIPSSALEGMNLGALMGAAALGAVQQPALGKAGGPAAATDRKDASEGAKT